MLASSFSTRFLLRKNRRSRSLPPLGATCSLPHFRFAQMWPRIFPRGLPGYVPLFPGWPRARTPALAPVRSHFAPRNRAAGHRPHRGRCFAVPVTAAPRRVPNGKTPALAPVRSHFACGETARPVVAPAGGNVLATPFSLRSNVAPRSHPGPPRFQSGFFCAKTGGRVPPLSDGGALTKSENIILCASSCHPPRSPYPHCTLPRVRFSGIGQKKKPQRKPAAAVAYHSLFLSFRLCGTRSPACFVIRIHSTSLSSRGENKKGKRARFPFCFAPKGSSLPVLHSLFSLPLTFHVF